MHDTLFSPNNTHCLTPRREAPKLELRGAKRRSCDLRRCILVDLRRCILVGFLGYMETKTTVFLSNSTTSDKHDVFSLRPDLTSDQIFRAQNRRFSSVFDQKRPKTGGLGLRKSGRESNEADPRSILVVGKIQPAYRSLSR